MGRAPAPPNGRVVRSEWTDARGILPRAGSTRASVLLVDPFPLNRAGLAGLIRERSDLRVLGEAGTADEALQVVRAVRRRGRVVVLVSLSLAGEHDAEWMIATIREEFPQFVVIAVGAGTDASVISRALFVGADGFVDAKAQPEEFMTALHEALDGKLVLAGLPSEVFGSVADGATGPPERSLVLTPRERQVLTAAAGGLTAREIAARLDLRERTVTTHLTNVYGKLGVNGRIAAINLAVSRGLVDSPWAS